ncbi:4-oxalocrotonate tautomerase family protein [Alsobacter sp. SYSU M60028]|uniref:4-oxalocrotonate tautomerase family protein n=1 Tax=Alsobacter ponti TaxID=2962936 RepID=A0ABT1LG67_9HYPH|nr:4-oxalocrotonate tautomerase family protein [Alsobacter ponti]MCP8940499.1 4-oxalocrotonate tautomerase family protein [Alsobacter ponti]
MPFVNLKTTKTNLTREAKAQIVREFSETLVRVLGKKPENIHIVIDAVDDENWGHSGALVAHTRKLAED